MRTLIYLVLGIAGMAAVLTLTSQNDASTTVTLYADKNWAIKDQPLYVVLIASFFLGVIVTWLFGLLGKISGAMRSRKERKKHASIVKHHEDLVAGREYLAAGNFQQAESTFQKIYSSDGDDVLASSMLAETLFKQGNFEEALKVVDSARQTQKDNVELLFLGSDINEAMENYTAAYDNASLVHKQQPNNIQALQKLIGLCEPLKRYPEAIGFQKQLLKLVSNEERSKESKNLADLELGHARLEAKREGTSLKKAISDVVKRHRNHGPSLAALASIESEEGNYKSASKLWSKAYQSDYSVVHLERIADSLIEADEPAKAVEIFKKSIQNVPADAAVFGRISLVNLYLRLEMIDEAKEEFDKLSEECSNSHPAKVQLDITKAELIRKAGSTDEAFSTLKGAVEKLGLPNPLSDDKPRIGWEG